MQNYKIKYLLWIYILRRQFPKIEDKDKVGKYSLKARIAVPGSTNFGSLLEYRVWVHDDDGDICNSFENLERATWFSLGSGFAEQPIALVKETDNVVSEWAIDWLPIAQTRFKS